MDSKRRALRPAPSAFYATHSKPQSASCSSQLLALPTCSVLKELLEENAVLLKAAHAFQQLGRVSEADEYLKRLNSNLSAALSFLAKQRSIEAGEGEQRKLELLPTKPVNHAAAEQAPGAESRMMTKRKKRCLGAQDRDKGGARECEENAYNAIERGSLDMPSLF